MSGDKHSYGKMALHYDWVLALYDQRLSGETKREAGKERPDISFIQGIVGDAFGLSRHKNPQIAQLFSEALERWDQLLIKSLEATNRRYSLEKDIIESDEIVHEILAPEKQSNEVAITTRDPRIWRMIRMILLIDKGHLYLLRRYESGDLNLKNFKNRKKRLARPLNHCLLTILKENSELHQKKREIFESSGEPKKQNSPKLVA